MNFNPLLHTTHNNSFKVGHSPIHKRLKLLKESTGNYFYDLWLGKEFLKFQKHNLFKRKLIKCTSLKLKFWVHQNIQLGKIKLQTGRKYSQYIDLTKNCIQTTISPPYPHSQIQPTVDWIYSKNIITWVLMCII